MFRPVILTFTGIVSAAAAYAAPPASAPTRSSDPRDRIVCTSTVETGSLVQRHRVCMSQRDRDRQTALLRAPTSDINSCRTAGTTGQC